MKKITDSDQFKSLVEDHKGITAVLFTQAFIACSRCTLAKHAIKTVKTEVPVFELETTMDMYPTNTLGIKTVPTLVIFKAGNEVARLSGTSPGLYKKEYQNTLHTNY